MSDSELDRLLEETTRQRIGPLWLAEIRRACSGVASHFDPAIYGVAEDSWTAAEIDDLVQDVTTEQLLRQAQLDYIIDVAFSIDDVRRLLRHQARRALIRRRRRTVVDQLLDRLKALLNADGYEAVAGISPARYRPTGSDFGPGVPQETTIGAAAAAVRLLPTSSGSGGRAPAVFRTEVLEQILILAFEATASSLSISDLGEILRRALTSWVPVVLEGGDQLDPWPADPVDLPIELEETMNELMQRIDATDREILRAKLAGISDATLAGRLDISRPTVARRKNEAFRHLRDAWMTLDVDLAPERIAQEVYLRLLEAGSDHG